MKKGLLVFLALVFVIQAEGVLVDFELFVYPSPSSKRPVSGIAPFPFNQPAGVFLTCEVPDENIAQLPDLLKEFTQKNTIPKHVLLEDPGIKEDKRQGTLSPESREAMSLMSGDLAWFLNEKIKSISQSPSANTEFFFGDYVHQATNYSVAGLGCAVHTKSPKIPKIYAVIWEEKCFLYPIIPDNKARQSTYNKNPNFLQYSQPCFIKKVLLG